MKLENRVIHRINARELTPEEVENIKGGTRTLTICTVTNPTTLVGGDETNSPESC